MKCPTCPATALGHCQCLGEVVPRLCQLAKARPEYRRELRRLARERSEDREIPRASVEVLLSKVACCHDRGGVLPASEQPACGCLELTECRAGRGERAGRVTLQDCLACVTSGGR